MEKLAKYYKIIGVPDFMIFRFDVWTFLEARAERNKRCWRLP